MDKKKFLFKLLIFAVVLCLNLNLIVAFAEPDTTNNASSGTTTSDTTTTDDSDEDTTEEDLPENINYKLVASNKNLEMYFDYDLCYVKIVDKKNGNEWSSSPDYIHKINGNAAKLLIGSLIHYTFYDVNNNTNTVGVRATSIDKGTFKVSEISNGVKVVFTTTHGFVIPVELVLNEDSFSAAIVVSEIKETLEANKLANISLLPFFGAASSEDEGYALVPDGSGAIIDFNQPTSDVYSYSQRIYGRDAATEVKSKSYTNQEARLPIFGINKNGMGVLAVLTESPAAADVNANVIGQSNRMNNVYFSYLHRAYDTVYIREATWNQQASRVIDTTPNAPQRFETSYYFLDNDSSDYTGMANRYQQYLRDELGVTSQVGAKESKLYIEFLGGIKRLKNILGFPINTDIAITSFEDVANIATELNTAGIKDLSVILTNWTDNTTDFKIPYNFKPESSLGGKREFNNMLESLNNLGAEVFPDVNLTNIRKNSWSYKAKRDVIQSLGNSPVTIFPFKMSTYEQDKTYDPIYLLRYDKMPELAEKVLKNSSSYNNITGLSAATVGQLMYSSFGKKSVGRTQSEQYAHQALQILSQNSKMLFSNPNAYVFQYASDITDIPLKSSQYLIETRDVPFYQIAMHGLLNYSTESLNAYYDQNYYMLKAIETGSDIKYTLGAQNLEQLQYTEYEYYSYINYDAWKDTIIETYKTVSYVNSKVSDARIIGHEYLVDGVVMTTYDNGIKVIANYNSTDYNSGNIKCSANNFAVLED